MEVVGLREKVELLSVEKTLLEQQITESLTRRVEEEEQEDKKLVFFVREHSSGGRSGEER